MKTIFNYILSLALFVSFASNLLAHNADTTLQNLETNPSYSNTLRYGVSYSALNTLFFSNGHLKDNRQVSLANIAANIDYFLSEESYLSLNFGYNFYSYYTGGVYLQYDEHIDHFFTQILYSQYLKKVFWGIGLGFSYTYHIFEYEDEVYQYIPMIGESVYIGNEYYLFESRNSSIDLGMQIGTDLSRYFNVGLNFNIALLNLRDQTNDFTQKATMGITIGLKFPGYK